MTHTLASGVVTATIARAVGSTGDQGTILTSMDGITGTHTGGIITRTYTRKRKRVREKQRNKQENHGDKNETKLRSTK